MPRAGMSAFRFFFSERFSGHFFLKFFSNKILMGNNILVPCFLM